MRLFKYHDLNTEFDELTQLTQVFLKKLIFLFQFHPLTLT